MPKIATFYDHIVDVSRQESCSVVDALKLARELGVEAVEASANNLVGREDEMGQELAMADLSISSVPSYFDFGRDFDVERQALPIVEAAQYLGAVPAAGHPRVFSRRGIPPRNGKPNWRGWWKVSTGWRTWPRATASLW